MQTDVSALGPLYSPAVVRGLLESYGLRPDKAFGQNFLIDGNVLGRIVEAAAPASGDTTLEIGPGLGTLTRALAAKVGKVISVELDAHLLPVLQETVGDLENVELIHGDGLEYDLSQLPPGSLLVANLPYNVGTPILVRALESGRFKRLVVMVQREVAERLSAAPSTAGYGALTPIVAQYGVAQKIMDVKPGAFFPTPEVTSSVVRIDTHPDAHPDTSLTPFIHTAFRHRRKTLKKNLLMAGIDKTKVDEVLRGLSLDPKIRAEALPLEAFQALHHHLKQGG